MNLDTEKIADDLKAAGYDSQQVSIKRWSWKSTYLAITICDPHVSYTIVEAIRCKYEHIRRDESTGEILDGGNTFIDIAFAEPVKRAWSRPYLSKIKAAMGLLVDGDNQVSITERFSIGRPRYNVLSIHDKYDPGFSCLYVWPRNLAIAMYIRDLKLQEHLPKDFVLQYWFDQLCIDKQIWNLPNGQIDIPAMFKQTAEEFKCASEKGDSPKEKDIATWIAEFARDYPGMGNPSPSSSASS